jgi:DNA-binding transcriptional ArsR family regulator
MGELVAGRPIAQLHHKISASLDLISYMSLLYRSVPGSGLNPELIAARRSLPDEVRTDLDLLHGFSGRLLYYMEEPILHIDPLRENTGISCAECVAKLESVPELAFQEMAEHALARVHRDLGTGAARPEWDEVDAWREYLLPALTTAAPEDAYELIRNPRELKQRTIGLIRSICASGYADEFEHNLPTLRAANDLAARSTSQGFGLAFSELTGNRLPSTLVSRMNDVERVTFVPSYYLGVFVSYILSPPDLIVYYSAPEYLARTTPVTRPNGNGSHAGHVNVASPLGEDDLLEALKALSDSNRLRIVELLASGELYAQEIVGRLAIAQSAVSRHLSLLERARLITVTPRRGMKYYSLNEETMDDVAASIRCRCSEQ